MRILFIRHALAVDRENWNENDLYRPLSSDGEKEADDFFEAVAKIYKNIDKIYCSKATRAIETSSILNRYFKKEVLQKEELNPDATFSDFKKFFSKIDKRDKIVAIIGHEPNLSQTISPIISNTPISIKIKKSSLVEIELYESKNLKGELRAYITPKIAKKIENHYKI